MRDRWRSDRDRARHQRGRHVGAAGRGDGRRVRLLDPRRPPARRDAGRAGHELARDAPCFRDPDNLVYGKAEAAASCSAATSRTRSRAGTTACRGSTARAMLPPDNARFQPLLEGAIRRFPFLEDAGVDRLLCHPDAMTPDGNPLLGPMPGVRGLLARRRPVAERLRRRGRARQGARRVDDRRRAEVDVAAVPRRGASAGRTATPPSPRRARARSTSTTTACATRSTSSRGGAAAAAEPAARAPAGARRGVRDEERLGARRLLRAGRALAARGRGPARVRLGAPPYLDRLAASTRRSASASGIIDMTSFGKLEVAGAGALALLERVCDNRIDRPVGARRLHAVPRPRAAASSATSPSRGSRTIASASSRARARSTPTAAGSSCTRGGDGRIATSSDGSR